MVGKLYSYERAEYAAASFTQNPPSKSHIRPSPLCLSLFTEQVVLIHVGGRVSLCAWPFWLGDYVNHTGTDQLPTMVPTLRTECGSVIQPQSLQCQSRNNAGRSGPHRPHASLQMQYLGELIHSL